MIECALNRIYSLFNANADLYGRCPGHTIPQMASVWPVLPCHLSVAHCVQGGVALDQLLDLSITLTPPPAGSPPETMASMQLRCDQLGLSHSDDLLLNPLTPTERAELRWYLEEYWEWPYEQFLEHGRRVEQLLPQLGKRLYRSVFGSLEARDILQAWRSGDAEQRPISIISGLPPALSLPWELLHDEQGFLTLRARTPVSILRRLPQGEQAARSTPFEPPLRVLLITARPDDAGFVDPRGIARELLDEVQKHVEEGTIAVEFLR